MVEDTDAVVSVLLRFLHVGAGIFWIGLLYYFNVVQVPVFKKFDAATRSNAIQKLAPLAMAWFRYAALATIVFGILLLWYPFRNDSDAMSTYMESDAGVTITAGMILGLVMFLNVWLVIWPNQKKIIQANRDKAATGKEIPPDAAAWGKQAFYASRLNFLLSFPMLFFMVATNHLGVGSSATRNETLGIGLAIFVVAGILLWVATSAKGMSAKPAGTTPPSTPPKP